ncbi:MAG TPA: AAA family ATPase [Myxococcota bacterium]|nr:AAA family ATPase [Myxococcota bacterium]
MKSKIIIISLLFLQSCSLLAMDGFCDVLEQRIIEYERSGTREEQIQRAHNNEILGKRIQNVCYAGIKCAVIAIGSNYLMSNPNFLMFAGLIGFGFRDKLEGSVASLQNSIWPTEDMKALEAIELELKLNEKIPEKRVKDTRARIRELRARWDQARSYMPPDRKETDRKISCLKKLVALPTSCQQLQAGDRCKIIEDAMASTFDRKLVDAIKLMVFGIEQRSMSTGQKEGSKPAYLFIGAPGTGKTETAKLIAKCLGLPFFKVNLAENPPESLCCVRKIPGDNNGHEEAKITECFLKAKVQNCVFFFDEAHDALRSSNKKSADYQSVLKRLLTEGNYFDEGLETEIFTKDIICIFAANIRPDDAAGALLDRMECFDFLPAVIKARTTIANKFLDQAVKQFGTPSGLVSSNDETFQQIIKYDAEHCSEQGVRPLERVIEKYVLFRMASSTGIITQKSFEIETEFASALGKAAEKYKN